MTPCEIEVLFKLCRKHGISKLETGDIKIELSNHTPQKRRVTKSGTAFDDTNDLTPEQLLFYSSNGIT